MIFEGEIESREKWGRVLKSHFLPALLFIMLKDNIFHITKQSKNMGRLAREWHGYAVTMRALLPYLREFFYGQRKDILADRIRLVTGVYNEPSLASKVIISIPETPRDCGAEGVFDLYGYWPVFGVDKQQINLSARICPEEVCLPGLRN